MSERFPSNPENQPDAGSRRNGLQAFLAVGRFLDEDGWHPRKLDGKTVYRCDFAGRNGDVRCYAQVRTDLQEFIFYAVATIKVPEAVRGDAAEFITRANYGLRIGNLEMDYGDGEVRFKSSVNFDGEELTPGLIRNTMYPAVETLDHYLPGIMRVAFGGLSPWEAIAEIEGL